MKKICFIAQFPPPIHGLSKAVEVLYESELSKKYKLEKINITENKLFLINLLRIFFSSADVFYLTISSSVWGNIRDILILFAIKIKKKKSIVHLHGGYYRNLIENNVTKLQKKINYFIISRQDSVIVLGESFRYIFEGMIDKRKIYVVPNGVESLFVPNKRKLRALIQQRETKVLHILYLSNLIQEKGYRKVLSLANYVTENSKSKIIFDFAGRFYGKEEEYFFDYIENNNLKDIVKYHGVVTGKEKKTLLEDASFFILITNYPKEGQPISILEAMANGLYIITTDFSGIGEVVINNENGALVSKDISSKELFDIVCLTKEKLNEIAINNNEVVLNKYTQSDYIRKMTMVFDDVIYRGS